MMGILSCIRAVNDPNVLVGYIKVVYTFPGTAASHQSDVRIFKVFFTSQILVSESDWLRSPFEYNSISLHKSACVYAIRAGR